MKITAEQKFLVWLFLCYTRWLYITFDFVDKILKCDYQMKAIEKYFRMVLFIVVKGGSV